MRRPGRPVERRVGGRVRLVVGPRDVGRVAGRGPLAALHRRPRLPPVRGAGVMQRHAPPHPFPRRVRPPVVAPLRVRRVPVNRPHLPDVRAGRPEPPLTLVPLLVLAGRLFVLPLTVFLLRELPRELLRRRHGWGPPSSTREGRAAETPPVSRSAMASRPTPPGGRGGEIGQVISAALYNIPVPTTRN